MMEIYIPNINSQNNHYEYVSSLLSGAIFSKVEARSLKAQYW